MRVLAIIAALLVASGCSGSDAGQPGVDAKFPAAALSIVTSEAGTLSIEVRTAPDQPPERGTLAVEYRVSDAGAGAPVDGLVVDVLPWMPAMGHGSSITPEVHPMGDGRYVVTNVNLFMPGRWELRTTLSGQTIEHATPILDIP